MLSSTQYGQSFWGPTAKIIVSVPSGERISYFLKVRLPVPDKTPTAGRN